jgi:ABC-type transporter MlaC component
MKKIIPFALLFCSFNALAQSDPQKMIDEFFKLYKEKSSDAALDYVFDTNKWMKDSKDQIENVKFKLNSTVVKAMGDYYGYDLITKKTVGDKLTYYTFLLRYDRQPIRFNFLFYSPNGQWRLLNFSFDDSIKEDLVEASKAYRLKENLPDY